jgi:UDP-N-acetylglucosamine 4,6-dehydratase
MSFDYFNDKSILVTGGTGTLGKFCVEQFLKNTNARRVIVLSRDEYKQSKMSIEFEKYEGRIRFFLGDVRDKDRLERAFKGVDYVVHTAALKQVNILEYNPYDAIQTNIEGTQNVIDAAVDKRVEKVLLISTDKSANPVSLYGATKLCSEKLMVCGNFYGSPDTKFSAIRFGNIFGSRGSFVQLIEEQKKTGVIKLTHEDMSRFWVTAGKSVDYILKTLIHMKGGEIFVPKLPSMTIKDFIKTCAPNCEIVITGMRPGERIHEVLLTSEEARHSLEFDDSYIIFPENSKILDNKEYSFGKSIDEDFVYASNKNDNWISSENLLEMLESV